LHLTPDYRQPFQHLITQFYKPNALPDAQPTSSRQLGSALSLWNISIFCTVFRCLGLWCTDTDNVQHHSIKLLPSVPGAATDSAWNLVKRVTVQHVRKLETNVFIIWRSTVKIHMFKKHGNWWIKIIVMQKILHCSMKHILRLVNNCYQNTITSIDHMVIMRCMVSQCWFVLLRQTWCTLVSGKRFASYGFHLCLVFLQSSTKFPSSLSYVTFGLQLLLETSVHQVCLSRTNQHWLTMHLMITMWSIGQPPLFWTENRTKVPDGSNRQYIFEKRDGNPWTGTRELHAETQSCTTDFLPRRIIIVARTGRRIEQTSSDEGLW